MMMLLGDDINLVCNRCLLRYVTSGQALKVREGWSQRKASTHAETFRDRSREGARDQR